MSYSQNNEEKIILDYFKGFKGTLLSFGENDGVTLSNCRALMQKGWFAHFIEPSPIAAQKLRELYVHAIGVTIWEAAASDYEGQAVFHDSGSHLGTGDTSLLSTLNESEQTRWKEERFESILVKVMDAAIFNHVNADFISIDAEGEDIKILRRLSLFNCELLCIEWNSIPENKKQIDEIMLPNGFTLLHKNAENLIYSKK